LGVNIPIATLSLKFRITTSVGKITIVILIVVAPGRGLSERSDPLLQISSYLKVLEAANA
jgi:hypothetical protein